MTGKIALIIGIIIILFGGGYFFLQSQRTPTQDLSTINSGQEEITQNNATPSQSPTVAQTVEYTNQGFVPQTVTVGVGTTVTFVNRSSDPLWVASDPHPVHTDLSGFDAKQQIPQGGSYSFTFNNVGEWGYHNHLNSNQKGTMVVTEP